MMVEADNLRLVLDRLDEMDKPRGDRLANTWLRLERCTLQDAQGDRRVARLDQGAGPARSKTKPLGKLSLQMQAD